MTHPIDMETWPRREIFDFYNSPDPFYSVSFPMDVTGVYRYARSRGLSFYLCMCWAVSEAVNRVENFRYVIRGEQVFLLDRRNPSFTEIHRDTHLFYLVTVPFDADVDAFCRAADEKRRSQTCFVEMGEEGDDLIFITCLPEIDLTSMDTGHPESSRDSVPRINWGRYHTDAQGRKVLGMALELNHRLIDGYHVGCFARELEAVIAGLDSAAGDA